MAAPVPTNPSLVERLQAVPPGIWLRIAAALLALAVLVIVLRKVAKMNKIVLTVVVGLVCSIVGFNWIYERNEPAWATPVIARLATFLPTKNAMK